MGSVWNKIKRSVNGNDVFIFQRREVQSFITTLHTCLGSSSKSDPFFEKPNTTQV